MRNYTNKAIKQEKRSFFTLKFNQNNSREFWRYLNKLFLKKIYNIPETSKNPGDVTIV